MDLVINLKDQFEKKNQSRLNCQVQVKYYIISYIIFFLSNNQFHKKKDNVVGFGR